MPEGISQVLFVVDGRFTQEQIDSFNLVKDSIFKIDILKYVTIVRTKFNNFGNKDECEKYKKKLLEENDVIREIIESCKDIIHVDNPPTIITANDDNEDQIIINRINSNARKRSRKVLLEKVCQGEYFKLEGWNELH